LCRLEVKLTAEDREQLLSLISLVYRAGENAGSEQRAVEIRQALGLQTENESGGV